MSFETSSLQIIINGLSCCCYARPDMNEGLNGRRRVEMGYRGWAGRGERWEGRGKGRKAGGKSN